MARAHIWFPAFFRGGWNLTSRTYSGPMTVAHMGAVKNLVLKNSYRATIGGRPIFPLFTRGSAYIKTLIACDRVFFGAHMFERRSAGMQGAYTFPI